MDKQNYIVHPQKFALWLFILTVIMIFGGFTSAYIVQRGALRADALILFNLPQVLWYNLALILTSSITMQFSVWSAKQDAHRNAIIGLGMTFILGLAFLLGQWEAFKELTASGLPFVDKSRLDNSVSFFYVITGVHGLHIVAALLVLAIALGRTALQNFRPGRRVLTYELTAIFWHFLGLLWVYLFIFLKYTQN